ncbi:hypothetical protein Bca4012_028065 [Brassica carinata]|uniref:Uncharacterized protein n=1 Tax=Brassica carinata TaxID=52824 RepID=A0A8X7VLK7_BRACI|nr:hypothetical protein Bca52824_096062 [Brassica carinata]KAG2313516.1 hypothetical protein Bca52824_025073 [Brassica carinata]
MNESSSTAVHHQHREENLALNNILYFTLVSFTREPHRHRRDLIPKRSPYKTRVTNRTDRVTKKPDPPTKRQNLTTPSKADCLPQYGRYNDGNRADRPPKKGCDAGN